MASLKRASSASVLGNADLVSEVAGGLWGPFEYDVSSCCASPVSGDSLVSSSSACDFRSCFVGEAGTPSFEPEAPPAAAAAAFFFF